MEKETLRFGLGIGPDETQDCFGTKTQQIIDPLIAVGLCPARPEPVIGIDIENDPEIEIDRRRFGIDQVDSQIE